MMSKHRLAGLWPVAVAAALGLALPACGGSSAPAAGGGGTTTSATTAPHSRSLDTKGFESGTPAGLTDHERAEVTRDAAKNGSFGFDTDAQQSNAYGRWDAQADGTRRPWWSFRAWVRIVSWTPGESVDLFTVENLGAENNFDLFISAPSRAFQWDLYRENTARSGDVELGRWYLVEARGSFATGTATAEVRIDGVAQPSIASPDQPRSAVKDFVLGSVGTTKTKHVQFDDVRIEVADTPVEFLGP